MPHLTFDYYRNTIKAKYSRLDKTKPYIFINGKVSYYQQNPVMLSKTVRDNILFGQDYEENKYKHIIDICSLTDDICNLPDGDLTIIGSKGTTLSGG